MTLLGTMSQPPFVFFPVVLLLAVLGGLGYWLWARRPGGAEISEVTILHRAPTLREYESPPAAAPEPPALAPAPAPPIVYESPHSSPAKIESPPRPPAAPSGADVPPDLPEASD
jgi:hypothetical protein